MKPVAIAGALLAFATIGAAPRYGPVPASPQTAVVQRYVDAVRARDFDAAFALLAADERAYFGDAAAFRGVYDADGFVLQSARVLGARGDERGRVFFVRERFAYVDHASDARRVADATVPIGVLRDHGALRVKDPGKPYRAYASASSARVNDLRVTVKKVEFFADRIAVIATFTNLGDGAVTVLPYNKSVLRDDRGGAYRIVASKNWAITDKQLYVGLRLAPNAQYTGTLAFGAGRVDARALALTLTVAPALRAGGNAPFDVSVPIVARAHVP